MYGCTETFGETLHLGVDDECAKSSCVEEMEWVVAVADEVGSQFVTNEELCHFVV